MTIAQNTRRTYSTGETRYLEFCQLERWAPFPATDIMLCCFAASLASKVRPTSVPVYLSAVRNMHLELGYEDPLTEAMLLNRVVKGIGRHRGTAVEKPRLPITFPILRELINTCRRLNHHDKLCLQAAMLAIFFGFLGLLSQLVSQYCGNNGLRVLPIKRRCGLWVLPSQRYGTPRASPPALTAATKPSCSLPVQCPTLTPVLLNCVRAVCGYASLAKCAWGKLKI